MGRIVVKIDADLRDLVPGYLENRLNDISAFRDYLAKDDYYSLRRLAHRMKGSGGGYGFDEITAIGAAMEQAAMQESQEEIQRQIKLLEDFLDRVDVQYV